jgi:hypothetical protein
MHPLPVMNSLPVMPAQAGIQPNGEFHSRMDPSLRWGDDEVMMGSA